MSKENKFKIVISCLVFCAILLLHIPMTYISDDAVVSAYIGNQTIVENFISRWYSNGRIFTDVLANIFYRLPFMVWKIFDSLVYVVIIWLLTYLFTNNSVSDLFLVCVLIFTFPFNYLSSAGYIATTTNYVYPIFCLLITMIPFKKYLIGKNSGKLTYVLTLPAMVYLTNHDQSAMILIGGLFLLLLFSGTLKLERRFVKIALCYFILAVSLYLFMLLIPGHIKRMTDKTEVLHWFPEYFQWSFFQKIYHGYTATVANLLYNNILLFEIFCGLLFACALRNQKVSHMMISVIPIAVILLTKQIGEDYFVTYYPHTIFMPELYPLEKSFQGCIPLLLSIVVVLSIFASIILIVKNKSRKYSLVSLLILAAGSREMMGFSGTIYASSFRTFTAFLYILMISSLLLINELKEQANSRQLCQIQAEIDEKHDVLERGSVASGK